MEKTIYSSWLHQQENSIATGTFSSGIYCLRVHDKDGAISVQKIIIVH